MEEGGLSEGVTLQRTITATQKDPPYVRAVRLCFGKFYEIIEMSIGALIR